MRFILNVITCNYGDLPLIGSPKTHSMGSNFIVSGQHLGQSPQGSRGYPPYIALLASSVKNDG